MLDRLHKELSLVTANLARAQQIGAPMWPINEADTERIIIEPIIRALGYGELDYRKRMQSIGANFPDYLILPGSDQQWILEAKEWDARLDERCERQAVNYANNNGAQWAVLTNGRTWWVYNTRVSGDLSQQRVYELPDIRDTDRAVDMLCRLSRDSILCGQLDREYRSREICAALQTELLGGNRQIVRAIRSVIGRSLDKHVSDDDVIEALKTLLSVEASARTDDPNTDPAVVVAPTPAGDGFVSLAQLLQDPDHCTGRTPAYVRGFGVGPTNTATWRDVAVFAIERNPAAAATSLPFRAGPKAKRYFLNAEPKHADGRDMTAPRTVSCGGISAYAELHYSAHNLLLVLDNWLNSLGTEPDAVEVKLDTNNGRAAE